MNTTPTTTKGEQAKSQLIAAALAQFGEYGLGGDISRGRVQAILAKLRQRGSNQLAFGLFTFGCRWGRIHGGIKN